jgi:acetyl-CoA C-acetyltransferase
MNIYIIGAATTKFGELWEVSPRSFAREAVGEALCDAQITIPKIEALYVGNMLSGILGGQEHLGAFFADELGLQVPAFKIEGACASGGLAVHNAILSVMSGMYQTVAVLGIEKMTDYKPEEVSAALMGAGSDEERLSGITFPGLYAIIARAHMNEYGTTEEEMAAVAVKNHFHASLNPNAQFHSVVTIDQVLKSSCVADPLKLLDCSPISDGAACVIITSDKKLVAQNKPVQVVASAVATDSLGLSGRSSLVTLKSTENAALRAYTLAGIKPSNVDVAEVHDCFSIAEILAMEDLKFYPKGKAGRAILAKETTVGSAKRVVVNPSGGLKGCGHPVGATGVKQIVELVEQLRGCAGKKQVANAQVALAHNVGGSGATAVVHILKKG